MSDRISALDGLRAVAVTTVMAHHLHLPGTVGGWLGVDVFFVLSGYLITTQLLTPGWTLGGFLWRRAARLWPALLAMLAVVVALGAISWWSALIAASYVQTPAVLVGWGGSLTIGHCWSLAVEAQFYLVWAAFMLRARHWPRRATATACVLLAACSYGGRLALATSGLPLLGYYAAPARLDDLFLGSALAAGLPLARWSVLATPAALAAVAGVLTQHERSLSGLALGMPVTALATALAIDTVLRRPLGAPARILGAPALQWAGTRSYSLYLWHYPLFLLLKRAGAGWPPLQLAAAAVAAELSYRLVEVPARRHLNARNPFRNRDHRQRSRATATAPAVDGGAVLAGPGG